MSSKFFKSLPGTQKERQTIVDTGDDQWGVTGFDPIQQPAAKSVAEQDGVVVSFRNTVNGLLEFWSMSLRVLMEREGEKLQINEMRALGGKEADLAHHDLAGDHFKEPRLH